jgi:DNA polymerase-3 subunit alpha
MSDTLSSPTDSAPRYVSLRNHTEYSMVDGITRIKELISSAKNNRMPAVGLTDQSNMCALVRFYKNAQGAGLKPVIGVDIWVDDPNNSDGQFRLVLLAMNNDGYRNITELVSLSYTKGQKTGRPVVQREWLEQQHAGIIVLSGATDGDIGQASANGKPGLAQERAEAWLELLGDRFYIEIQRLGRKKENQYLNDALDIAEKLAIPVVATNYTCFIQQDDFEAHEARICINQGYTLDDKRRPKYYTEEQYFKTQEQMVELFADIPEALENTLEIAKRCNVDVRLGEYFLPNFPIPDGMTIEEYFCQVSREGLEDRLTILFDRQANDFDQKRKPYDERLQIELDVINQMGFPGYFLIVADFIQWSKNNGIPVGPGRGSGAGSIVAYALKITDLDPLEYDLLFERFLNPERVSMPDFDVDFCMDGRDRVIDYVAETYGRNAVSQIITFGTMAAKAVVRDVGRVLGHPYGMVDKIAKLIPPDIGMTLKKAFDQEEELQKLYHTDEEVKGLWDLALKLEGVTRNAGKHAGGVVIAPTKLTDFSPLYCDETGAGLVTQFDKDDVEQAGLVKFDFLGLRTLTIIDWALATVNTKRRKQGLEDIDIALIPTDDQATFTLLKKAETTAVFQLESRGMKELIKRLLPSCFEDIIALVALFRPGPLQSGMVDDFINRKHGRCEVDYPHPDLEPVLQPTYGVILYQEQVMQIAQVLAKYSLGGADLLRRAMGKKKPEVMAEQRVIFTKGALENNVDEEQATYIFDLMEKFAGYGFNKSHSAAYALVSYQTAWLKTHFPSAFMAAVMSADMDNTDKIVGLVEECHRMKIKVCPPDVNSGRYKFTVDDSDNIIYGIGAIKGVGEGAIDCIVQERLANGPYRDLFDFCSRIDLKKANKRTLEQLIRAGALDNLGPSRAIITASLADALKAADQFTKNNAIGQADLFGMDSNIHVAVNFTQAPDWPDEIRLEGEKETLGLYLTGHPIDRFRKELRAFGCRPIMDLIPGKRGDITTTAGLVLSTRVVVTKRGSKLAIVTIDDGSGRLDVTLFSEVLEANLPILEKDAVLLFSGEVGNDDFSGGLKMSCKTVQTVMEAREEKCKKILLSVTESNNIEAFTQRLRETLSPESEGDCPVHLAYSRDNCSVGIALGGDWRVKPTDNLINELKSWLGKDKVEIIF